jgi:hypothetical protein
VISVQKPVAEAASEQPSVTFGLEALKVNLRRQTLDALWLGDGATRFGGRRLWLAQTAAKPNEPNRPGYWASAPATVCLSASLQVLEQCSGERAGCLEPGQVAGAWQHEAGGRGKRPLQRVNGPSWTDVVRAVDDQDRSGQCLASSCQLGLAPGQLQLAPDGVIALAIDGEPWRRHLPGVSHGIAAGKLRRPLQDRQLPILGVGAVTIPQLTDPVPQWSQALGGVLLELLMPSPADSGARDVNQGTDPARIIQRVLQGQRRTPRMPEHSHPTQAEMAANSLQISDRPGNRVRAPAI